MGENKINTINLNDIFQDVKTNLIGKLLNDTKDSKTCMWYLICALDGMSDQEILELSGYTIPQIQDARAEFLKKKYQSDSSLSKEVQTLKDEVSFILQENRDVRSSVEAGLDKAIQEQIEKANKLIEAKDEMITMIKMQKVDLQRKNEELQSKVAVLEKQQTLRTPVERNQTESESKKHSETQVEEQSKTEEYLEREVEVRQKKIQPEERKISLGKRIHNYLFSSKETKKFIAKYLKNDQLTEEQKEYILKCLEDGVEIKELSEFAFESLTVEQMERLRKINEKRKE